jgi:hypothetical protein
MKPTVKKKNADAKAWWYELVVLPAVLVIAGTVILHVTDGVWWGIMLWVMASPLVYLLVDFVFFGQKRLLAGSDAKRPRRLVRPITEPLPDPRTTQPDWSDAEDVSTGAEILRRGRRYDQRRRA